MSDEGLVEHFFRHESGRLVATLKRRFGISALAEVEDAVQTALARAVATWPTHGQPDNPSAWLYTAARNEMLMVLRQGRSHGELRARFGDSLAPQEPDLSLPPLRGEMGDDMLRMLFVCCDESLATEVQVVLALKILCGFSVPEIAQRMFANEAGIYKRLARGRARLKLLSPRILDLTNAQHAARIGGVCQVLYALFSEGYLSSRPGESIRQDLCEEALRLTETLARHEVGAVPEVFALLALMHLHLARLPARYDETGDLLLLEEQDRSLFERHRIAEGLHWLTLAAAGNRFTRFHAEAGIAAEHCMAATFAETRWDRIISCYDLLFSSEPSPLHLLNRAVSLAELAGPEAALAELEQADPPLWLSSSHLWATVLADLNRRAGQGQTAQYHAEMAIARAPTEAVRRMLKRRLQGR